MGACAATLLRREVPTMTNRFVRAIRVFTAGQFQPTGELAHHVKLLGTRSKARRGRRLYARAFSVALRGIEAELRIEFAAAK